MGACGSKSLPEFHSVQIPGDTFRECGNCPEMTIVPVPSQDSA